MRALIYVRVSSADQVTGFSLDVQERACRDYCATQKWAVGVGDVYREEGESAKTMDRRELQKILARLARPCHGIARMVVYDLSRFARRAADHLGMLDFLAAAGVRLSAVTQTSVDETSTGVLLGTVLAGVNEFSNAQLREKSMAGMKAALASGRWPWRAPLGYRNVRTADDRALIEHDPRTGPLVQRAFERMASGAVSQEELRAEMAGLGLQVPRESFSRLLHNGIYCGRLVAPKWGSEARATFRPLVSEELFDRTQAVLSGSPSGWTRARTASEFPLRYWTRCVTHRRPVTAYRARGRNGSRYPYYRCVARPACLNERRERVDDAFRALLGRMAWKRSVWRLWEAVVRDRWTERVAERQDEQRAIARQLSDLEARAKRLMDAYLDRGMEREDYDAERQRIAERRASLRQARAALGHLPDLEPALEIGRRVLENPAGEWDAVTAARRSEWVRLVFPEHLLYDPNQGFRTAGNCLLTHGLSLVSDTSEEAWYPRGGGSRNRDPLTALYVFQAIGGLLEAA